MSTVFHDFYHYTGPSDMPSILEFLRLIAFEQSAINNDFFRRVTKRSSSKQRIDILNLVRESVKLADRTPFNVQSEVFLFFEKQDVYLLFSGVDSRILEKHHAILLDRSYDGRSVRPETISESDWSDRFDLINRLITTTVEKSGLRLILTDELDVFATIIKGSENEIS